MDQTTLDRLAQALAARIIPYLPNTNGNGNGNGSGSKLLPKRLLTVEEAAPYIGRSVSALYHLVARGEIGVVRHGRNLRFDIRELDRWIESDKS